jgi:Zn-dependent protease
MDILLSNPFITLGWIGSLILAITLHEAAHAFMADRLGDPTPRSQGRLTINPIKHVDLFGTIILPILLLISTQGQFVFGWAKPVEFDPYNLKRPRRDTSIIALAGPAINMILAIFASLMLRSSAPEMLVPILYTFIITNVGLAVFNLIPVHPLDGSKILLGLLPRDLAIEWEVIMRRYGTIILLLLILPLAGSSPLTTLVGPVVRLILTVLIP